MARKLTNILKALPRDAVIKETVKEGREASIVREFQLPPSCSPMFKELQGMNGFDESTDVLRMSKPGYRLKMPRSSGATL